MNKSFLATTLLASALALVQPPVQACGEGQFNMGQGLRYQRYLAPRPATVLVYDDGVADRKALYAGLQKAGHTVTVVGNPAALSQALGGHRFDVVISDFDQVDAVAANAGVVRSRVLPVVERSQRNAPEVRNRFKLFLIDGASLGQYLKLINQLVQVRAP